MSEEMVNSDENIRQIQFLKKILKTWLLIRDPHNKVRDINHPLILSFWDFCQSSNMNVTCEQKEIAVREFLDDNNATKNGADGNRQ